jgi:hypothetical protein
VRLGRPAGPRARADLAAATPHDFAGGAEREMAGSQLAQPETWEAGNGVAASVLGALRAARTRIGREARLHASQPGEKGLGAAPRRLALVELQQLFVGEAASGGVPNPHRLCADARVVRGEKSPRHMSGAVATRLTATI